MRKINLNKSPESHCPRFNECSINKCPLNKDYEKLKNDNSDPSKIFKEKCSSKSIRREIGKAFGLRYGGLSSREFNGEKNHSRKCLQKDFISQNKGTQELKREKQGINREGEDE